MIEEYGDDLESIDLVRGSKGQFEITVGSSLVFSKSRAKRHPNPGEIVETIRAQKLAATG